MFETERVSAYADRILSRAANGAQQTPPEAVNFDLGAELTPIAQER